MVVQGLEMEMIDIFNGSCLAALILLIWFETEALLEYAKVFRLNKLFKINEYEKCLNENLEDDVSYPDFLASEYNNFFTRLISCPICLGFWVTLCVAFYLNIELFPVINILSMLLYFLTKKVMKDIYGT